jgi:glucokinase
MPDNSSPAFPLFVGVDVGGTNIKIGVVDDNGDRLAYTKFPTQADQPPEKSIERIGPVIQELLDGAGLKMDDVAAVGLGTPGPMDIARGLILTPFNMPGWHNFPIRDAFSKALDKPVTFTNDANAAAFGEYWIGSGRQFSSMILITLGTGVGGGIIIDDVSVDGAHSHGSEIGHICIDTGLAALVCPCGKSGHLEAYASATGIVNRAKEALRSHPESSMLDCNAESSPLSALMVSEAADAGDKLALQLVSETAMYLGRGIAQLAHVIDPEAFILGGAVDFGGADTALGRSFLDGIIAEAKRLTFPVVAKELKVSFAQLESDAGYVGAAGMARTEFMKSASA